MPTKSKHIVQRSAKSQSRSIRVRLRQINADRERDFCHRVGDALSPENLKPLAESLVSEGQQTPLTVFDSGQTDKDGLKIYLLIGGFRRFRALTEAVRNNLDSANIHEDMEVEAVEVVRGTEQSQDEYKKDLLIRSVAENEQRKNFTTDEKLRIVKQFHEQKIPAPRAASALAMSETQYGRFLAVAQRPWLHDYVRRNCIGMTDAAELVVLADKFNWVEPFKKHLDEWVRVHEAEIEREREELAKIGKKLSGTAENVRKFLDRKLVQHWQRCIEGRRPLSGSPEFQFGILIDHDSGTITVPGRVFKASTLRASDVEVMIGELQDAVDGLLPILKEQRLTEEARQITDEEKHQELTRIQELRRQKKTEREKALHGTPVPDFHQPVRPDLDDVVTEEEGYDGDDADHHAADHDDLDASDDDASIDGEEE